MSRQRQCLIGAVVLCISIMSVAVGAGSEGTTDWRKWFSDHYTDELFRSKWEFRWMKIELPERVKKGEVVEARLKARFDPNHKPPGHLPVRVIWDVDDDDEFLSDKVVDAYVGPDDTLSVRALMRAGGSHLGIGCYVFLEHVADGAAVRGEHGFNPFTKDYWWYSGEVEATRSVNPEAPDELIPEEEARAIEKRLKATFEERLEEAASGLYEPPEEACSVIDSMLPEATEKEKRQLAYVAEYLAAEAKEPVRDAAWFVSNQAIIWARSYGKDQAEGPQLVLAWANKKGISMLESLFRNVQDARHHPSWALWDGFRRVQGGAMTWDELEELVDEYEEKYPDDEKVQRAVDGVRGHIRNYRSKEDGSSDAGEIEERDSYCFVGNWYYRDHEVTQHNGLDPNTTDKPVPHAWVWYQIEEYGGPIGPDTTDANGKFVWVELNSPYDTLNVYPILKTVGPHLTASPPPADDMMIQLRDAETGELFEFNGPGVLAHTPAVYFPDSYVDGGDPTQPLSGAGNIWHSAVRGWNRAVATPNPGDELYIRWAPGKRSKTRFSRANGIPVIYVQGGGANPSEWNDDSVLHEFGHFMHWYWGGPLYGGGSHKWYESYPNTPGLAVQEGWAHFYLAYANSGDVLSWHEGYKLKALGGLGGNQTYWCNLENPWHFGLGSQAAPPFQLDYGLWNEASVAACFYDMWDSANEVYGTACPQHNTLYEDQLTSTIESIWDALMNRQLASFHDFLNAWYDLGNGHESEVCQIVNHHGIGRWLQPKEWAIESDVMPGGSVMDTLLIWNKDLTGPRDFNAGTDSAWVTVSPTGGTIGAGDSLDLVLSYDAGDMTSPERWSAVLTIDDLGTGGCGLKVRLDLQGMYSAISVTGRVADETGAGIENAKVDSTPPGASPSSTDETGYFQLGIPEGVYDLRVWADGYYPRQEPDVTCPSDVGDILLVPHESPEGSAYTCTFYGTSSRFQGDWVMKGDIVEVKDPDGVLCGQWSVESTGSYGPMTVYGDDAATTETDEGAEEGDALSFFINNMQAEVLGPDDPIWHAGGGPYQVELEAEDAPPRTTDDLIAMAVGSSLLLQWSPVIVDTNGSSETIAQTRIYRSLQSYFQPGESSFLDWLLMETEYWDGESGVGDADENFYYRIVVTDNIGQDSEPSNTVGEIEFLLP